MHIGWVAAFDPPEAGPSPSFAELAEHIAGRLERVPRYHQRLASVPFGLDAPRGQVLSQLLAIKPKL